MATPREIKKRIQAVGNTKKITKTMEMVSTAKAKKAVDRLNASKPYSDKLQEAIRTLASNATDVNHPLLKVPDSIHKVGILVITSNRGLCGGFNNNVIRLAVKTIEEYKQNGVEVDVTLMGKKAISTFKFNKMDFAEGLPGLEDNPVYEEAAQLANQYMDKFIEGEYDKVEIISTRYLNSAVQEAQIKKVLPLTLENTEEDSSSHGGGFI
ncbi:MAG: F0F1 ATP synthase subunit gamma, partial [Candidatus Hydrogenedentota bacterium]